MSQPKMEYNTKMLRLPVGSLKIHPRAQRELAIKEVKKIVANFDFEKIGVLHAVDYEVRNENHKPERALWVVDGQSRVTAMLRLGLGHVQADVKLYLDVKDDRRAAELFLGLNDNMRIHPFDLFENMVLAEDPGTLDIVSTAGLLGLKIRRNSGVGVLTCVAALRRVHVWDKGECLAAALKIIVDCFGFEPAGLEGSVVQGIAMIYRPFSEFIEREVLVKKLKKFPGGAPGLIGSSRKLHELKRGKFTMPRCVAITVLDLYNSGRRTHLLDEKKL